MDTAFGSFLQQLAGRLRPTGNPNADPKLLQVMAMAQAKQQQIAAETQAKETVAAMHAQSTLTNLKQTAFTKWLQDNNVPQMLSDPKSFGKGASLFMQGYHNFVMSDVNPLPQAPEIKGKGNNGGGLLGFLGKGIGNLMQPIKTTGNPIEDVNNLFGGGQSMKGSDFMPSPEKAVKSGVDVVGNLMEMKNTGGKRK